MALIDPSRLDDFAGIDEVVSNQRVRGYRKGTAYGTVSDSNATQVGVMWMQGTGVPTSFASGNQNYSAQNIGGGLIIHKNAGAVNGTLDSTSNIITYMNNNSAGVQVGDIIQCQIFNTGSGILTIVPGDANTTPDANGILTIPAGVSKTMNLRLATASTLVIYM